MTTLITIPTLTTARLTLRAPTLKDAPVLTEFFGSDRAAFVGGPMDAEATWRHLGMEIGHWHLRGFGRWIVDETATGRTVGLIGLFFPEGWPEPEIGWDLFAGAEGRGYATEAGLASRDFAYDTLGWTTAVSLVKSANTASARVAQRMGARRDGTFQHTRHGLLDVWRHLAPEDRADGGMEAYA